MKREDYERAFTLLLENFWILRSESPEDYFFLRKHQVELGQELRNRFGMNLIVRAPFIQIVKRPHELASWMGDTEFIDKLDYVLFALCMAYVEEKEEESAFMMDDLTRALDLMMPETVTVDWTLYHHRRSLVRALLKMENLHLIQIIQGDTAGFEESENNQEILFMTTPQTRYFLAQVPASLTEFTDFDQFWEMINDNRNLEANQVIYQRLIMEPQIQREKTNPETFTRLNNYYRYFYEFFEEKSPFTLEVYKDYASLTVQSRKNWQIFPSNKVVDDILIQLATLIRADKRQSDGYGRLFYSQPNWQNLIKELQKKYQGYWSKEFKEMSLDELEKAVVNRGIDWQLMQKAETGIYVNPVFARIIAEMEEDN